MGSRAGAACPRMAGEVPQVRAAHVVEILPECPVAVVHLAVGSNPAVAVRSRVALDAVAPFPRAVLVDVVAETSKVSPRAGRREIVSNRVVQARTHRHEQLVRARRVHAVRENDHVAIPLPVNP